MCLCTKMHVWKGHPKFPEFCVPTSDGDTPRHPSWLLMSVRVPRWFVSLNSHVHREVGHTSMCRLEVGENRYMIKVWSPIHMEVPLMLSNEQELVANIIPRENLKFEEWELTTYVFQNRELTLMWDGGEMEEEYKQIAYTSYIALRLLYFTSQFFTLLSLQWHVLIIQTFPK